MKEDKVYLDHIVECLDWIEQFTVEGRTAFLKDRKTQSAVLRELQILSESTQHLSDPSQRRAPGSSLAGNRGVSQRTGV